MGNQTDILVVGGGLAGGLVALAMTASRPEVTVRVIERGGAIGGNHFWSFFDSDLGPDEAALIAPLVAYSWNDHEVQFFGIRRQLKAGYRTVTSEKLDQAVRAALGPDGIIAGQATALTATTVTLEDGRTLQAGAVIDARGFQPGAALRGGWQKFLGRTYACDTPHGIARPIIMDARVLQQDGYRFVYVLPLSATEVFIEDTYYADEPGLDLASLRDKVSGYASVHGCNCGFVREETGVLPVVAGGDFDAYWRETGEGVAKAGVRAGLFHPLTSYSLPDAARFARFLAGHGDLSGAALAQASRSYAAARWRERGFYRMLAAMLFGAAHPQERVPVFRRFYALPEATIERFYAQRLTLADKARLLIGKPPVRLGAALLTVLGIRKAPLLADRRGPHRGPDVDTRPGEAA